MRNDSSKGNTPFDGLEPRRQCPSASFEVQNHLERRLRTKVFVAKSRWGTIPSKRTCSLGGLEPRMHVQCFFETNSRVDFCLPVVPWGARQGHSTKRFTIRIQLLDAFERWASPWLRILVLQVIEATWTFDCRCRNFFDTNEVCRSYERHRG